MASSSSADRVSLISTTNDTVKTSFCASCKVSISKVSEWNAEPGEGCVWGPEFTSGQHPALQWQLGVFPNGYKVEDAGHLSAYLCLMSTDAKNIKVKYEIKLIRKSSGCANGEDKVWSTTQEFSGISSHGSANFIDRATALRDFSENDSFTFVVKVWDGDMNQPPVSESLNQSRIPDPANIVQEMLSSADDFEKSEAFAAMFETSMKEGDTGEATIEGHSAKTIKALINFLHFGDIGPKFQQFMSESDNASRLFEAANAYTVAPLRELCLNYMIAHIADDNVIDYLVMTTRQYEGSTTEVLKAACVNYIEKLANDKGMVVDLPGFERLMEDEDLLKEMVRLQLCTAFARK